MTEDSGFRPDLPDGIDPTGVQRPGGHRDAFLITVALVIALLALCFTLGWIVFHHLITDNGPTAG